MAKDELRAVIAELNLSIKSEFVPWSKSRNAKPTPKMSDRSLNWRVTLCAGDREVLTTDYAAGIAHCPAYDQRQAMRPTLDFAEKIAHETETGRRATGFKTAIKPDAIDVIYSLVSDSEAIDYSLEDWASNYGYNVHSRSAKKTYRACLIIGLKLNNSLGSNGLGRLREAAQDY